MERAHPVCPRRAGILLLTTLPLHLCLDPLLHLGSESFLEGAESWGTCWRLIGW